VTYDLFVCEDENFTTGCFNTFDIASLENKAIYYAGIGSGVGLLLFGIVLAGGVRNRRKISLMIAMIMIAGILLVSCGGGGGGGGGGTSNEVSYTVSGLKPGTTYYWKVVADDGKGGRTESPVWSFITQ